MKKELKKSGYMIKHSQTTGLNRVIDNPNCTMFGERCDQPFTAFYVWEKFFAEHGSNTVRFLELGCDVGGTSTYLALCCLNAGIRYIGFDKRRPKQYDNNPVKVLAELRSKVVIGNLYSDEMASKIKGIISEAGKTLVFCDCIDKPWEFETFAPSMKVGDIIAVHDWDRAIKDEWVKDTMAAIEPYELLYEDERLQLNTLTRFFLRQ